MRAWTWTDLTEQKFEKTGSGSLYRKIISPEFFDRKLFSKNGHLTESSHDRKLFPKNGHLTESSFYRMLFFENWSFDDGDEKVGHMYYSNGIWTVGQMTIFRPFFEKMNFRSNDHFQKKLSVKWTIGQMKFRSNDLVCNFFRSNDIFCRE
jgi:hypothetical protein